MKDCPRRRLSQDHCCDNKGTGASEAMEERAPLWTWAAGTTFREFLELFGNFGLTKVAEKTII